MSYVIKNKEKTSNTSGDNIFKSIKYTNVSDKRIQRFPIRI